MISMLIEGTTAKQCYERGKVLGLKKLSIEECRAKSLKLVSQNKTSSFSNKKVLYALKKFVLTKLEGCEEPIAKAQLVGFIDYIRKICEDYEEFRKTEDNLVLFGGELELNDIKRVAQLRSEQVSRDSTQMQTPFVIVPVSRTDFQMLSDPALLQLLSIYGVNINQQGQIYPRVDSTVQVKTF